MKSVKNIIWGTVTVLYMVLLVIYVKDVGAAVLNSLKVCFEVMIPSLYAFMAASGFVVSSNLYIVLSKPFGFISRYIFRIPQEYFSVFLIGSIGGYPVGARLLSELYEQGKTDKETAEQMLSYCYLAGPAFICGIAGVGLFSSVKAGMIIFASAVSANILIAIICGLGRAVPPKSSYRAEPDLSLDKLVQSVYGGAKGMFSICAIIVFFSTVICILEKSGIIAFAARELSEMTGADRASVTAVIKSIIEISNISSLPRNDHRLIPLTASLLSFGGLCVLMQVNGFIGGKLSAKRFYFFRILAIIFSYLLCKIYLGVFDFQLAAVSSVSDIPVQAEAPAKIAVRQSSPIPTLFLLIMTILLLLNFSMEKKKKV